MIGLGWRAAAASGAVALLAVLAAGWMKAYAGRQAARADRLEAELAEARAGVSALESYVRAREAVEHETMERLSGLERAVAEHLEWSACAVPADVAGCLCDDGEAPAGAVPAAGALRPVENLR